MLILLENGESFETCEDELIRARFLVPEGFDERKQALDAHSLSGMLRSNSGKKTAFTILTTTDCNARCFYCYEMGRKRLAMSEQIAHVTAAYMARVSGGEQLRLHWFGGEPLYNRRAIEIITGDLRALGISFRSRMTTNGYYLDAETARTAKCDWNLQNVQITLDGTEEIYQRSKAFIEGDEHAFERVLNNIVSAIENEIHVVIRLNVNQANEEDLMQLTAQLAGRFRANPLLRVYPHLLFSYIGSGDGFADEREEYRALEELQTCIRQNGLGLEEHLKLGFRTSFCMADNDGAEVLLPDGRIGKCEHYSETEIIASIYSAEYDEDMIRSWKEYLPPLPECDNCPLLPHCRFLRKCPSTSEHCCPADREHRTNELTRLVLAEYETWKAGKHEI